jgi:endonuclease YncB( thermonuclease family)
MERRLLVAAIWASLGMGATFAQSLSPSWFPIPASAIYETGDSWSDGGVTYRLYGVQSCLRGTRFTNAHGLQRDCGEASLAMLAALIRDLRPQCYAAAEIRQPKTIFVFCIAIPTWGAGKGSRIDLGTALIATGFAFAAMTPNGRPVHAPYLAAERVAQNSRAGLWAFPDLPDPNAIIQHALRSTEPSSTSNYPAP